MQRLCWWMVLLAGLVLSGCAGTQEGPPSDLSPDEENQFQEELKKTYQQERRQPKTPEVNEPETPEP